MSRKLRYLSLFSGVEAASLAFEPLGWEPIAFAEIDEFPAAVLAHHWPDVTNLGDVTKIDWGDFIESYGRPDVIVAGSPCFPAGTLVMCESGYKPIEDVVVGERVVTHTGRLCTVVKTGSKQADTIVLKGQGSVGIECTPNHPFYARTKSSIWNNSLRKYVRVVDPDAKWVEAKDMLGKFWLNVCNVERLPIPDIGNYGPGKKGCGYIKNFDFTPEFFYFVGRWLADGWLRVHERKGRKDSIQKSVIICCAHEQGDFLEQRIQDAGLHACRSRERTAERFTISSTQLHDWLYANFGKYAWGKNIPAWCIGMDEEFRIAIVQGYMDADGCTFENGYKSSTVSRALHLGIKAMAGSIGIPSSVVYRKGRDNAVIEGRHVNERPSYISSHYYSTRSSFFSDSGYYGKVRKVTDGRKNVTVYNLEVDGDHSYTADGIAVHNCTSFSIAGKRESLDGESRLMFEFIRAVDSVRPEWVIFENVPAILSTKDDAFGQLLSEMERIGYTDLAWRVLDAQYARTPLRDGDGRITGWFGPVPQRRRRLFLVGHFGSGDGFLSAAVLVESKGMYGDTPPSRETREEAATDALGGVGGGDPRGAVAFAQNQSDEVRLTGGDGRIADTLLCMASGQANAEIERGGYLPR